MNARHIRRRCRRETISRVKTQLLKTVFLGTFCISCLLVYVYLRLIHKPPALTHAESFRDISDVIRSETGSTTCGCPYVLLKTVDPTVDADELCAWSCQHVDVICQVLRHQTSVAAKVGARNTSCLLSRDDFRVPNIVYYVIMAPKPGASVTFQFLHYLSVLSVHKFQRPASIYVIGDVLPSGYWWERALRDVRGIRHVTRPRPHMTLDGKVHWVQHLADVVRLQVLLVNGGIYMDTDTVLIRTLDPLRGQQVTLGLLDEGTGMGNALVLAPRGAPFLASWYRGYLHYRQHSFNYNSMKVPLQLWKQRRDWLHLESENFYRPNWYEASKLFNSTGFPWKHRYAVHVWHRLGSVPRSPRQIRQLNSTLGEILRYVYFGSSDMLAP